MYKVNDLKRLKKVELLEVAAASKLHLVSAKSTKRQLIETLLDHGVCQRSPAAVDSVACDTLPVDFTLDCLFYRTVTDHTLHIIPNCSFYQLYAYFRGTDETSVKSLDRAAKHASAGDITCVKMCQVDNLTYVTAICAASQKTVRYSCYVALVTDGTVVSATCECTIGLGGRCSHVGALLFKLQEYKRCNTTASASSTSKLCRWSEPRSRNITPRQLSDIPFEQTHLSKGESGTPKKRSALQFEPRLEQDRILTVEHCQSAVASLASVSSNTCMRHLWGSPEPVPDFVVEVEVDTTISLQDQTAALIMTRKSVPTAVLEQTLTSELVEFIEKETLPQTKSTLWHDMHRGRITSSLFGNVYRAVNSPSLVNRILDNKQFTSKATSYGKQHEPTARRQYEELLGVKVQPTGLTLLADHHYIGASSDGIAECALVEIKCPLTGEFKNVEELVDSGYSHVAKLADGSFALKETSEYYCQVQGEMAVKGYDLCHFIVWTPKDFEIISVPFDKKFWTEKLLPKLTHFFDLVLRPELQAP